MARSAWGEVPRRATSTTSVTPAKIREKVQTWVFLGPALAFLTLGIIVPAVRTTFLSLFTGPKSTEFVGLDNYKEVFTDSNILIVLRNNLMWAVLGTFFSLFFGVVVARLADRQKSERLAKALIAEIRNTGPAGW